MKDLTVFIRPSFAKVAGDPCKAALFDHILYQIAKKAKGQPREAVQEGKITYYKTNEELTELMLNTWGLCKVRKAVNDLMDLGLIGKSKSPWGADRTKHFHFGQDECRKLLDLCQKHNICLHNIGLDPQVIQLIILSNGNDDFIKCSCNQLIKLSNGNDESIEAITKRTPKRTENKENNERMNGASQRKATVSTQDESFIHSFDQSFNSSSFSSQETKPTQVKPSGEKRETKQTKPSGEKRETKQTKPEVVFSPEAERIYGFAEKLKLARLKRNETNRDYCETLAKEITTQEQMDSLAAYSREKLKYKGIIELYLGNLVTDLNGWSQVQAQKQKPLTVGDRSKQPIRNLSAYNSNIEKQYYEKQAARGWQLAEAEGFVNEEVADSDIADMIEAWARGYKDVEHTEEYQARVKKIQRERNLDNSTFFGLLYDVKDDTDVSGDKSMQSFFRMLDKKLGRNKTTVVGITSLSAGSLQTAEALAAEKESHQRISEQDVKRQKKLPPLGSSRAPKNPKTDVDMEKSIKQVCKACKDTREGIYIEEAKRIQQEFGVSYDDLCTSISSSFTKAVQQSGPNTTMSELFNYLREALSSKVA